MARLVDSSFVAWQLTEQESLEGAVLNNFQRMLLQTDLTSIGEQIIAFSWDMKDVAGSAAKHGELMGQKLALQTILDRDVAAQELLKSKSAAQNQS